VWRAGFFFAGGKGPLIPGVAPGPRRVSARFLFISGGTGGADLDRSGGGDVAGKHLEGPGPELRSGRCGLGGAAPLVWRGLGGVIYDSAGAVPHPFGGKSPARGPRFRGGIFWFFWFCD